MVMWARSAVRSVLTTALRMPKKAAAPAAAKKEKVARIIEVVKENTKTGDPMTGINYLKAGKGASIVFCVLVCSRFRALEVSRVAALELRNHGR